MAAFLHYLPGKGRGFRVKDTGDYGSTELKALIHEGGLAEWFVDNGPDGKSGMMVATVPDPRIRDAMGNAGAEPEHRYDPDRQGWVAAYEPGRGQPSYWIGWEKDRPPGPADLVRSATVEGHHVPLGDGNRWLVPEVGPAVHKLPMGYEVGEDGEFRMAVKAQFREVYQGSRQWANLMHAGGEYSWPDAMRWAVAVLGLNYRLTARHAAANVLGLLDTGNFWRPFAEAALGVTTLEAEERAKAAAATP